MVLLMGEPEADEGPPASGQHDLAEVRVHASDQRGLVVDHDALPVRPEGRVVQGMQPDRRGDQTPVVVEGVRLPGPVDVEGHGPERAAEHRALLVQADLLDCPGAEGVPLGRRGELELHLRADLAVVAEADARQREGVRGAAVERVVLDHRLDVGDLGLHDAPDDLRGAEGRGVDVRLRPRGDDVLHGARGQRGGLRRLRQGHPDQGRIEAPEPGPVDLDAPVLAGAPGELELGGPRVLRADLKGHALRHVGDVRRGVRPGLVGARPRACGAGRSEEVEEPREVRVGERHPLEVHRCLVRAGVGGVAGRERAGALDDDELLVELQGRLTLLQIEDAGRGDGGPPGSPRRRPGRP